MSLSLAVLTCWLTSMAPGAPETPLTPEGTAALATVQPEAPRPPVFGERGQWLVGGRSWGGLYGQLKDGGGFAGRPGLHFVLAPELAYFVARHLAVGGYGEMQVLYQDDITTVSLAVGAALTGHVPLTPQLSLLPAFRGGYRHQYGLHRADMLVRLDLSVALAPHVQLALGPYVQQDVYANDGAQRGTVFGLSAALLAWL